MTKKFNLASWSLKLAKRKSDPDERVVFKTFPVSLAQAKKIEKWRDKQDAKVAKKQGLKDPYYGAIGGSLTYCFNPTSIGLGLTVQHSNGEKLDVTDYDSW